MACAKLREAGLSRADAIRGAARNLLDAHTAWLARANEPKEQRALRPATSSTAPTSALGAQPAAAGAQLTADEITAQRARWDKLPAVRAVYGDNFQLWIDHAEGRITFNDVYSLREASASAESREMWEKWDATRNRASAQTLFF